MPSEITPRSPGLAPALIVVSICGWMVMELEILGARILAPFFGSSVYVVMGSVIGVFLISLAAGYLLGGWVSEKAWGGRLLGIGLAAAGTWLVVLPHVVAPVCDGLFDAGFDDKWGSLAAALLFFGAPTAALGMAPPMTVRRLTRATTRAGRCTGLVLAVSTAASFAGCLTTAFYLVRFSWKTTLVLSGVALGVVGVAVLAGAWRAARPAEEMPR